MTEETNYKSSYERILKISDDYKQITLPDSRFYQRNGEYYPSITHVLNYYPKGKHFEDWLKKVGFNAEYISQKAAEEGTAVHNMIESYLQGNQLTFLDPYNKPKYKIHVWEMFLKFVEFWETYNPTLIEEEIHLFSEKYKIAGTCDLICEFGGERWVIDFKTSNNLHTSQEIQVAIYAHCFEECYGKKIDRKGILWLKSTKRKASDKKIQGKGWELFESSRPQEENIKIFEAVKILFDLENPNYTPISSQFPTAVQRKL